MICMYIIAKKCTMFIQIVYPTKRNYTVDTLAKFVYTVFRHMYSIASKYSTYILDILCIFVHGFSRIA